MDEYEINIDTSKKYIFANRDILASVDNRRESILRTLEEVKKFSQSHPNFTKEDIKEIRRVVKQIKSNYLSKLGLCGRIHNWWKVNILGQETNTSKLRAEVKAIRQGLDNYRVLRS